MKSNLISAGRRWWRTAFLGLSLATTAYPRPPNVVLILADDLGWADCSPNGGKEIPTPNMARIADLGMVLSHAFVSSPASQMFTRTAYSVAEIVNTTADHFTIAPARRMRFNSPCASVITVHTVDAIDNGD